MILKKNMKSGWIMYQLILKTLLNNLFPKVAFHTVDYEIIQYTLQQKGCHCKK